MQNIFLKCNVQNMHSGSRGPLCWCILCPLAPYTDLYSYVQLCRSMSRCLHVSFCKLLRRQWSGPGIPNPDVLQLFRAWVWRAVDTTDIRIWHRRIILQNAMGWDYSVITRNVPESSLLARPEGPGPDLQQALNSDSESMAPLVKQGWAVAGPARVPAWCADVENIFTWYFYCNVEE